jgi:plasmid stabilization system protein ParE
MNLRYTVRALRHIEEIHKYIAERDTEAARRVVLRIERSIGRLASLPLSGRPGVVAGTRILVGRVFHTWRSIAFVVS